MLVYTNRAGVTAAAGTRLAHFLHSSSYLGLSHSKFAGKNLQIAISRHYLAVLALGNLRACCLP